MERVNVGRGGWTRREFLGLSLGAGAGLFLAGCGGSGGGEGGGGETPSEISFWGRAANETINRRLVEAYNDSHKTRVKFTVFPDDQFVSRVGTAAASGDVPDVLAVDMIYMPQFNEDGLMLDVTDRARALPFFDALSPSHMRMATSGGKIYAVPRDVDASSLFWNKELFRRAGLDPEKAPSSWREIERYAWEVNKLGGDVRGYYFAGNCAGCNAYTLLPLVWAAGGEVVAGDGAPTLDTPQMRQALEFYDRLWEQDLVPRGARTDNGENWLTAFGAGNVGIQPLGAFAIGALRDSSPDLDFGVGYLPGPDGGRSSFAGGDAIGVPAEAKNPDAAWDFISWTLSEDVQVGIVAKGGGLVARTDLIKNKYSKDDPAILTTNSALEFAKTPKSTAYNEIFNNPNGPFLNMFTQAVFGGNVDRAVSEAQQRARAMFEGQ